MASFSGKSYFGEKPSILTQARSLPLGVTGLPDVE